MNNFNIIIKNGKVMDGNGNPWFHADIGIEGKKITKVGNISTDLADRIIDAKDMIVSPGFVDIHNHSDVSLLVSGRAESMVRQGVTTMLTCNCGGSPFPLLGEALESAKKNYGSQYDLKVDWSTIGEYKTKLKQQGISINVGLQIGHQTLRTAVIGYEDRAPTPEEMEEMKQFVVEAMEAGCFGMSSGLGYTPGMFSETGEIIELCKIVAKYGGIYSTHARNTLGFPGKLEEAIEIGEKAGLPVQFSHIASSTWGRKNWGKAQPITLRIIDTARARGVDITADIYAYIAGSYGLKSIISRASRDWVLEGGLSKMLERLAKPENREKIKKDIALMDEKHDWSQLLIASLKSDKNKKYVGKTVQQAAEIKGVDPVDLICDLLIEEEGVCPIWDFFGLESDIRTLMKHESVMMGSDGYALEPIGVLARRSNHPRCYSNFSRIIETYVGEGVLSLPEAVHKMSGMPAWRLGLRDRGIIKPGSYADITIFDPFLVKEKSTWTDPHKFPEGIPYVLVNGSIVVDGGEHTGAMTGEILLRP